METKTIEQSTTFCAPPMDVYEMLMDSKKHAAFRASQPRSAERSAAALRPGELTFRDLTWHYGPGSGLFKPGGLSTGRQIITPSRYLSSTQLMVAPSSTLPKSVCRLTATRAISVAGCRPIGRR
jgi:hypothetical protein